MNERIKELALECHSPYGNFDHEKFAILIVKDCIREIETYRVPVGNSAAGEMACEWTLDALKVIRDEIQVTFGLR